MKKIIALMLSVLMLTLCGCKSAPGSSSTGSTSGTGEVTDTETGDVKEIPWLTMVVDSPMIPSTYISQFLESVPGYGTEFQVEFETINQLFMVTSGGDGKPAEGPEGSVWWLNEANYESFCNIRDQISTARFYSLIDREAMSSVSRAYMAEDATQDSVREAVHKAYMTMNLMLAES